MNVKHYRHILSTMLLTVLLLTACSDWDNMEPTPPDEQAQNVGITFSGSVAKSTMRADGSIINLNETSLRRSQEHTYWRADANGEVSEVKATFYAGIFGCYTGQYKWSDLVNAANQEASQDTEGEKKDETGEMPAIREMLNDYYTPNLFFNQQASISAPNERGINALTYSPQRFWPNNKLKDGKHEYVTLWAYYPYNPTASMGQYGITMHEHKGHGMDSVSFTMNPDAAQQVDFMMSAPVMDCNKDDYPLISTDVHEYTSKPVPFKFYHMLSQIRIYAFINGVDRIVYQKDSEGNDLVANAEWFDKWEVGDSIKDAYGNKYTKKGNNEVEQTTKEGTPILTKEKFVALHLKVPNEAETQRWKREDIWDITHTRRRAKLTYQLSLNNIKSSAVFYPEYHTDGTVTMRHTEATTLSSATVNRYIMNPYWFEFGADGSRTKINDDFMFGYFEDRPKTVYSDDPLRYLKSWDEIYLNELADVYHPDKHYNFNPGNILMVVPQKLEDSNVPHITLTVTGENANSHEKLTAKLTINMLKMDITWESGYIYCYAFLDDLRPGDDKVQGPESITVIVDKSQSTDQW